jgi:hypothetical protein
MRVSRLRWCLAAACLVASLGEPALAADLAQDPARVCNALKAEGLPTSEWTAFDDAFGKIMVRNYRCLSEPMPIRGGGEGRFITALNYFAEGRVRERVETIRLVLNVHAKATRAAGLDRFGRLSASLFANLGVAPPAGLAAAIREAQPGSWNSDYGTVRFEVWQEPVERLRLSINLGAVRRP